MRLLFPSLVLLFPPLVFADESPAGKRLEEVVVYGRSEQLLGTAQSASEGLVGYDDIQLPPLLRVGELVESIPGMVATQHSGTGKANQYFLRGFNLDHGTDFAASAEGVPLNMRSHGHGQGYLDLNFLIPELVKTAAYRKGPYAADVGDFASAGSVEFTYYDRLPETLLSLTAGEHGYGRGLLAGSAGVGSGTLTGAADVIRYDGPWALEENLRQEKFHLSYALPAGAGNVKVILQGYDAQWDATDQIPRRAVASGMIDELGFIDPDLGGRTERYALNVALEFDSWRATAYAVDYDFSLISNFTYFLDDPELGDEFQQLDRRRVYGLDFEAQQLTEIGGRPLTVHWGGAARYDDVQQVGLFGTAARRRKDVVRLDSLDELSAGAFGEAEMAITDRLRLIAGMRADHFDWQVDARLPANGGSGNDTVVSPNAGLAFRVADDVELYASWGRGFHSNDVRGATMDADPVPALVDSEGAEAGVRFERGRAFNATLTGFWLELDSELVYVGDAGTTEANDATERYGLEAAAFWEATDWLAINAAYTVTDARFKRDQGGGREVPGAVESTFTLGANTQWSNGMSASARVRYLSDAALIEDGSVRADDSVLVNAGIGYRRGRMALRLETFNLLDSDDADISYFYASRLPGEPAEGVEDVHFHPLEPRSLRGTITLHW